jgi:hypothetical protein
MADIKLSANRDNFQLNIYEIRDTLLRVKRVFTAEKMGAKKDY